MISKTISNISGGPDLQDVPNAIARQDHKAIQRGVQLHKPQLRLSRDQLPR